MVTARLGGVGRRAWMASAARAAIAGFLCASLIDLPVLAEALPPGTGSAARVSAGEMAGEQRVLHALNRLTFGPRPGEVSEVERVGLKRWFDMQLNPQSIDDSALEARLSAFPAMKLPQDELIRRYPSPQMLRVMIQRDLPLPQDPVEHAIYADEIAFYKEAKARKADGEAAKPEGGAGKAMDDGSAAPEGTATKTKGSRKVDLLAGDASQYTMPGKGKKASGLDSDAQMSGMLEAAEGGNERDGSAGCETRPGEAR